MSTAAPTLAETQRRLQRWILCERGDAAEHADRIEHSLHTLHTLISGDPSRAAQRADVYHTAYRLRLDEVLANDYPVLAAAAGEAFADLADRYRQVHPSQHPSARWYGRHLPRMLSDSWLGDPLGDSAFGDLARLEWALGEAFDAADADALVLEDLAGLAADAWAELSFGFHPSVQLLRLKSDLAPLLAAESAAPETPIERLPEPADWLIWRYQRQANWRVLGEDEAACLRDATAGASFEALCERLCDWHAPDQIALRAVGLLKRWIVDGLIVRLRHPAMR